jgi:hypothetical protein
VVTEDSRESKRVWGRPVSLPPATSRRGVQIIR